MLLYDAAPIPLKSIGLGELAVFLVGGHSWWAAATP
jgi:1,4-dihydroxy-2-naphthoate octaprenyltransferase